VAIVVAHINQTRFASGLSLFHSQLLLTAFYLTINAIFGFSQAISEEKEDGTLGLLRLADISPLSILLGKTVSRIIDSGLMLGIQVPFTIVAITLGGVSHAQVFAAYMALTAYLWLLATMGIAMSVRQRTGSAAALWTTLLATLYILPPYLAMTSSMKSPWIIDLYGRFSLPMRLTAITESAFDGTPWCLPVAVGFAGGTGFLIWSWWIFDRVVIAPESAAQRRAVATPATLRSRRAWSNPLVWREFEFLTGGYRWLTFRIAAYLALLVFMGFIQDTIGHMFAWAALIGGLFAVIDGTWTASRLFRDEIRERTWSSLLQTPHSTSRLALDKSRGWLIGMLPSIVMPYLYIVTTTIVHENTNWELAVELLIGSLTVGVAVFGYLHLLVLMSLHYGWKATPLTLTITFTAGWIYVRSTFDWRIAVTGRCVIFVLTSCLLAAVMIGLQLLIVRRLRILGETA
jgi:ABC-type transport system involved in cytochrome c biogenesis permease component